MKKITVLLSVIAFLFAVVPLNVSAKELKQISSVTNDLYGQMTVMETDGWETREDGGKYIEQVYYVTKTIGGYVYIRLSETYNVKVKSILEGSAFTLVKQISVEGGVDVVLKAKSTISSKTEAFTVLADIVDPNDPKCTLNYSPLGVACVQIDDLYFDDKGNSVTKEAFDIACAGVTPPDPDVPDSPNTGSVIPYVAVGGGLLAVAGVYFFSRKSNKFYKI